MCCARRVLEDQRMEGELPATIGNLKNLRNLFVPRFQLLDVPLVGCASRLRVNRNLANNRICGSLPDSIGNLKNLEILFVPKRFSAEEKDNHTPQQTTQANRMISNNQFNGTLPKTIGNLSCLVTLFVER